MPAALSFFSPCRLTRQDPGLSSRGIRVRRSAAKMGQPQVGLVRAERSEPIPSGRPFSSKKRRFLFPRPDHVLPYRNPEKPAGGPSPAGAEFIMRSWRKSNAPVCQSGVGSASLPERTTGAVVFNSQHSGLLIRTVRVQLPPAPPIFNPRSLRTAIGEVFRCRVT
jgi:hypothetical protein